VGEINHTLAIPGVWDIPEMPRGAGMLLGQQNVVFLQFKAENEVLSMKTGKLCNI
jgi:hypothetical protein